MVLCNATAIIGCDRGRRTVDVQGFLVHLSNRAIEYDENRTVHSASHLLISPIYSHIPTFLHSHTSSLTVILVTHSKNDNLNLLSSICNSSSSCIVLCCCATVLRAVSRVISDSSFSTNSMESASLASVRVFMYLCGFGYFIYV